MVERWPHTFTLTLPEASNKDAQGNVIDGEDMLQLVTQGRAKEAGGGQATILAQNGDISPCSYTLTFPWFSQDFTNGQVLWKGKVYNIIRFRQYQNRCKIWI